MDHKTESRHQNPRDPEAKILKQELRNWMRVYLAREYNTDEGKRLIESN